MSTESNIGLEKSYKFALRIIKLYKHLTDDKKEFVISKQVLRSGTSMGANFEEAVGAQSTKDFAAKMALVYKETRETHYWLRLLTDAGYIDRKAADSILKDCEELLKITGSIKKTVIENK